MTQTFELQGSGEVDEDWVLVVLLVVLVVGKGRVDGLGCGVLDKFSLKICVI